MSPLAKDEQTLQNFVGYKLNDHITSALSVISDSQEELKESFESKAVTFYLPFIELGPLLYTWREALHPKPTSLETLQTKARKAAKG